MTDAQYYGVLERKYYDPSARVAIHFHQGEPLSPAERRRSQRIRLQIPMFVRGVDTSGSSFLDLTKTLDISATGAYLATARHIGPNQTVFLTIPAPGLNSAGVIPPETPPIQARIRRQAKTGNVNLIGVEFLRALE